MYIYIYIYETKENLEAKIINFLVHTQVFKWTFDYSIVPTFASIGMQVIIYTNLVLYWPITIVSLCMVRST